MASNQELHQVDQFTATKKYVFYVVVCLCETIKGLGKGLASPNDAFPVRWILHNKILSFTIESNSETLYHCEVCRNVCIHGE